ncbi:response regulator [Fulvivirga sediminis]|uniref:Response regulator n=1 Tax=Fulvivirga sediminis TaxID=2803949 RepID=A0A937JZB4_9BACT|nr:response regulator [Fulvivirga sediminis]MBL3656499.1 response regulator [Fulvivirga sediminis]
MNKLNYVIVEDNRDDLELILDGIKKVDTSYEVTVLRDGREAENFVDEVIGGKQDAPKVILLDLKLPMLSGLEILEKVKSSEVTKCIPVVIFTSSQAQSDITKAYELGANAFIVKPIDYNDFIKVIQNIGTFWLQYNE